MYDQGEGVRVDLGRAVRWFEKAAKQASRQRKQSLAMMYHSGDGVVRDDVLAYSWLNLAAAAGVHGAAERRDEIRLSPQQMNEATASVFELAKRPES